MRLQVPYIQQATDWSCSIAAAQMVTEFLGHGGFNQKAVYNRLKSPVVGLKGHWCVYNNALIAELRSMGFNAQSILLNYLNVSEMTDALRHHLDQGEPLIATQRASMTNFTGHSRVVVGYEEATPDGKGPFILVHDPSTKGVPQGGAYKPWKPSVFAAMWKPKGSIVQGGEAILIRR